MTNKLGQEVFTADLPSPIGPFSLMRKHDHAGDSGQMSESIKWDENDLHKITPNSRPTLGESMRVGSNYARSFSNQDWWLTTPVMEITVDTPLRVEFKTGNSEYVWICNA